MDERYGAGAFAGAVGGGGSCDILAKQNLERHVHIIISQISAQISGIHCSQWSAARSVTILLSRYRDTRNYVACTLHCRCCEL